MKGFLALFLILLLPAFFAVTLSAPDSAQVNTTWMFSARIYSPEAFTSSQIFYDNKLIMTVQNTGTINVDSTNGQFVIKSFTTTTDGVMNAYFLYAEKSTGGHTIKIITYKDSTILDESTKLITINSSSSDSLATTVSTLSAKITLLETKLAEVNTALATSEETSQKATTDLESALLEINSIKKLVSGTNTTGTITLVQQEIIQKRLELLEADLKKSLEDNNALSLKTNLNEQKLVSLLEKQNTDSIFGFFSLSTALTVIIILILFGAGTWIVFFNKNSKTLKVKK